MILILQVINGILLPVVLIFMVLLVNKRDLMKNWVNSRVYDLVVLGHSGGNDRDDARLHWNQFMRAVTSTIEI